MNLNTNDSRRRELAKIHIGAKEIGLDDDAYRAMLWTVARVRSAADLDQAGRRRVLDHLKALAAIKKAALKKGAQIAQTRTERSFGRPHNADSDERGPQIRKIEALLAAADRPWGYADSMAARMYKVSRVAFCNPKQLQGVIAALVYDAKRHGRRA